MAKVDTKSEVKPKTGRRQIGSLVKGLRVLEYVAAAGQGARVSEIARAFEMPTSNLTLFLNSLVETGYVIRNPLDSKYYASEKIIHIASSIDTRYKRLEIIGSEQMQTLHEKYDENIMLAVLSGYRLRFISTLQSSRNIQILNNDDRSFIPHVTAAGKAILAFLPDKLLGEYYGRVPLQKFTEKTITSKTAIACELEQVRANGYATNLGEYEAEVMAVAAPIFAGGVVQGSLIVQFPTFRYKAADLDRHGAAVIAAANKIGAQFQQEVGDYMPGRPGLR